MILDVAKPRSLGTFSPPDQYTEIRQELNNDLKNSLVDIKKMAADFKKVFGRNLGKDGLIEEYKIKDADTIFVAMGSVCGTIKEAIDDLRKKGNPKGGPSGKVGLLKIISFRPFPDEAIINSLIKAKKIIVIDKSLSLGTEGILATELKRAGYGRLKARVDGVVVGLGGRDITQDSITRLIT